MLNTVLLSLLACEPEGRAPVALDDGSIVFAGAVLVPSGEAADVVVRDGVITKLLDAGGAYTGDVEVIDAAGQFLSPGLTDLHVHLWYEGDFWLYLANGVTTVRNLFGDPQHLDWRAELESGERIGPTLITTGPIIDGPAPYWPGSASVSDAEEAVDVAEEQLAMGYDAFKVYDGVPLDAWQALLAAADAAGVPVVGHVPDEVGYDQVAAAGQRTVEHLDDVLAASVDTEPFSTFDVDAGRSALARFTDEAAASVAASSASAGVFNVPTLLVWHNLGQADTWDFEDPRLDTLPASVLRSWRNTQGYLSDEDVAYFADYTEVLCEFTLALHEAGAELALGTDVINPFVFPGASVHEELELLVGCGLSPTEALALATTQAAAAVEQPGTFGTIEVGARADLVLLDEDPTRDIGALADPVGVMAAGRWLTAEELQEQVDAVAESYARR